MFQFPISWFTQAALILWRVPQGTILVSCTCTNCCKKFNLGNPENISTSNPFILQPHTKVERLFCGEFMCKMFVWRWKGWLLRRIVNMTTINRICKYMFVHYKGCSINNSIKQRYFITSELPVSNNKHSGAKLNTYLLYLLTSFSKLLVINKFVLINDNVHRLCRLPWYLDTQLAPRYIEMDGN